MFCSKKTGLICGSVIKEKANQRAILSPAVHRWGAGGGTDQPHVLYFYFFLHVGNFILNIQSAFVWWPFTTTIWKSEYLLYIVAGVWLRTGSSVEGGVGSVNSKDEHAPVEDWLTRALCFQWAAVRRCQAELHCVWKISCLDWALQSSPLYEMKV